MVLTNPNEIANKLKRNEHVAKLKQQKAAEKRKRRDERKRLEEQLGDQAPPRQVPHTQDNQRVPDETVMKMDDEEVAEIIAADKFASHFDGSAGEAKLLFTTSPNPRRAVYPYVRNLMQVFPNSFFVTRRKYNVKEIVKHAIEREFTDVLIVAEHARRPIGLYIIHLPNGPTAFFKISNFFATKEIRGHGNTTSHKPELIVNNFTTQLGMTIGRMFAALIPCQPDFVGRRVVTFHNQRDYIFFRHHRYIFESGKKVRMQELGPRFTLKLRWLQHGTFDTEYGEYEWVYVKKDDTVRRKFAL